MDIYHCPKSWKSHMCIKPQKLWKFILWPFKNTHLIRPSGSRLPLGVSNSWGRKPYWVNYVALNFIFQIDTVGPLVSLVIMRMKRVGILECPWRCGHHGRDGKYLWLSWLECSPVGEHPLHVGIDPGTRWPFFTELLMKYWLCTQGLLFLFFSSFKNRFLIEL